MALEVFSLADIQAEVQRILLDKDKTIYTDALVAENANFAVQNLASYVDPTWWATTGPLTTSSGADAWNFPTEYGGKWYRFYDATSERRIRNVIEGGLGTEWEYLLSKPAGPIEAIQIRDSSPAAAATEDGRFWPSTLTGITPSVTVEYRRLPASMPNSDAANEYPDIPLEWQELVVWRTVWTLGQSAKQDISNRYKNLMDERIEHLRAA